MIKSKSRLSLTNSLGPRSLARLERNHLQLRLLLPLLRIANNRSHVVVEFSGESIPHLADFGDDWIGVHTA